mgnify:CR=1 FL=1
MNRLITPIIFTLIFSCSSENKVDERFMVEQKIAAFQFLSDYHHQLHVMIGEEEGNIDEAYNEFLSALEDTKNRELIPIEKALMRVTELNIEDTHIKRLDYLVDYYQSDIVSIDIEKSRTLTISSGNLYDSTNKSIVFITTTDHLLSVGDKISITGSSGDTAEYNAGQFLVKIYGCSTP